MSGAINKMKQDYQPIFQTGSQYLNSQASGYGGSSMMMPSLPASENDGKGGTGYDSVNKNLS